MENFKDLELDINEGVALLKQGDYHGAITRLKKVLPLLPDKDTANQKVFQLLNNFLGFSYANIESYELSIEHFESCLKLEPNNAECLKNCALSYEKIDNEDKALTLFKRSLSLDFNENLLSKVISLQRKTEKFAEADYFIQQGLQKFPESGDFVLKAILNNRDLDKGEKSLIFLDRNLSKFTNSAKIKFALSVDLFNFGHYEMAWKFYEDRYCMELLQKQYKKTEHLRRWDFSDLNGKTLLLTVEQGFGDSIHFFRYALVLRDKFPQAKIIFATYPQLLEVFKQSASDFEYVDFLNQGAINNVQGLDFYFPIMSLGLYFNISPDNPLCTQSYLKVKDRAKISKSPNLKVGLCWQGRKTHPNDKKRSIPLNLWKEILSLKNIDFFSLQHEATSEELNQSQWTKKIDYSHPINNFYDSAILINALDYVISIDSATAHLSAAMGKKTLIFLPPITDWRWGKDGEQSYWYESVKLLRQKDFYDWSLPFAEAKKVLLEKK